jgi:bifunctional non-homologous end joining protein LigD
MADRLTEYRRKRDARRTPEPVPEQSPEPGRNELFVIQQHHARRLHWDLRLERDGVLVSWALPRGLPRDPARNHLAVHTEDHPMEYLDFHGEIPAGEYGGGRMTIYDRGTYTTEKWRDREVIVVFAGARTRGRYVFFQTNGKDWMVHRMDPPEPGWTPMPEDLRPMLAEPAARLPRPASAWGFEMSWGGTRALAAVSGGRLRLTDAEGRDVTGGYPSVRGLGEALAPTEVLLDGELVVFEGTGRVRAAVAKSPRPAYLLLYDLLWLDGRRTVELPYRERRELLDGLDLGGAQWQTPPYFPGAGREAVAASREQGLGGVVAKRLDAGYQPGGSSHDWRVIPPG